MGPGRVLYLWSASIGLKVEVKSIDSEYYGTSVASCHSCLGVGFEAHKLVGARRASASVQITSANFECEYINARVPVCPVCLPLLKLSHSFVLHHNARPRGPYPINVRSAPCFREQRSQHPDTYSQPRSINSSVPVPKIVCQAKNTWATLIKLVDQPYLTSAIPYISQLVSSLGKQSGLS